MSSTVMFCCYSLVILMLVLQLSTVTVCANPVNNVNHANHAHNTHATHPNHVNVIHPDTSTEPHVVDSNGCKSRKIVWFMAVESANKDIVAHYFQFVLAALNSARSFAPSLAPFILHSGSVDHIPKAVRDVPGVNFISHNLTFAKQLLNSSRHDLRNLGPWYRLDIPYIMRKELSFLSKEVYDLDYVLYTDTDVLFFQDFNECSLPKPKVIYFGPEANHNTTANSGVMYMNVTAMLDLWPATLKYAISKDWVFNGPMDQGLYLEYYTQHATRLDDLFNWKGYWGVPKSGEVHIAHFHGPKPGGCLECYLMYRFNYKTWCPCPTPYWPIFGLVPDNGLMLERMLYAFRNFTHHH